MKLIVVHLFREFSGFYQSESIVPYFALSSCVICIFFVLSSSPDLLRLFRVVYISHLLMRAARHASPVLTNVINRICLNCIIKV